jgi:hypothetical protein
MGLDVSLNSRQINVPPVGSTGRAGAAAPLAGTAPVQGQNEGSPFSNPLQPVDGQDGAALQATKAILEMMNTMMAKIMELMGGGAIAGQNAGNSGGDAGGGSPVSAAGGSSCPGGSCPSGAGAPSGDGSSSPLASNNGPGSCSGGSCSGGSCSDGSCSDGSCSAPRAAARSGGTGGAGSTSRSSWGNVREVNTPQANDALRRSIERIAQDPEGAKLLQRAREKGLKTISVAQYDNPNLQGLYEGDKNRITVKDPNNIDTLVHELVHAATKEDGTSKEEEGLAKRIGSRVASRLTGSREVSDASIQRDLRSFYGGLRANNGSTQRVRQILS